MRKIQKYIPRLFYNQFFWQLILALFMIGMAAFFIRNEHLELRDIRNKFRELNIFYLTVGCLLTLLYFLLQGEMYVQSFKTLNQSITLKSGTTLFLKRNLVSIFLPAGGFSSLVFFSKDIENERITKSQVHLASSIFGVCGIVSVVIVAIPVLYYALLKNQLQPSEILGFGFLILLSVFLLAFLYSLLKKKWVYLFIKRKYPQWTLLIDEISSQQLSKKHFIGTLFVSIIIEFIGISHLYIAMLALGFEPSLAAAFIGYIVMVILLIASPFLRGLGAIEVSMTYILGQYGFSLGAAASITLLFRLFEFWIPLFVGVGSFFAKKDNVILRVLPAVFIFTVGIINLISSITPALPKRLRLVEDFLPNEFILASNALVMVSGLLLIIIAVYLIRGSKRAWYVAVILTSLSVIGHIIKAVDYEEAIIALLALLTLYYTRSNYKLKPHPAFTKLSFQVIIYGLFAILLYGILGFYFINKRHFGIDFEWAQSIKTVFKLFFLLDDSGLEARTRFGEAFIYSFYGADAAYLVFVVLGLLLPYFQKPYNTKEEKELVATLVAKYGKSALDYFKIYPDKLFFITADKQAFVSFKITRHLAVVLEDPIAANPEAMKAAILAFDSYCNDIGLVSVYYRVPEESLALYSSLKKKSFPIGEEAVINISTFSIEGGKMKPTRSAINRLTAEGFSCKIYEAPIKEGMLQKLEFVSDQWLGEMGQKEIAFTQGIFDRAILKNQTIITIEDAEEEVYAFLNLVPVYTRDLATYDLIRKVSNAPNGVLDMLLSKTLLYLKENNYQQLNMGLAPLSGIDGQNLTEKTVKFAYDNLKTFGQFKGLRKYKEKFFPIWEKKYIVYDHSYHLLQVPKALQKVSEVY